MVRKVVRYRRRTLRAGLSSWLGGSLWRKELVRRAKRVKRRRR